MADPCKSSNTVTKRDLFKYNLFKAITMTIVTGCTIGLVLNPALAARFPLPMPPIPGLVTDISITVNGLPDVNVTDLIGGGRAVYNVFWTGTGEPGSEVNIWAGNKIAGNVIVEDGGDWVFDDTFVGPDGLSDFKALPSGVTIGGDDDKGPSASVVLDYTDVTDCEACDVVNSSDPDDSGDSGSAGGSGDSGGDEIIDGPTPEPDLDDTGNVGGTGGSGGEEIVEEPDTDDTGNAGGAGGAGGTGGGLTGLRSVTPAALCDGMPAPTDRPTMLRFANTSFQPLYLYGYDADFLLVQVAVLEPSTSFDVPSEPFSFWQIFASNVDEISEEERSTLVWLSYSATDAATQCVDLYTGTEIPDGVDVCANVAARTDTSDPTVRFVNSSDMTQYVFWGTPESAATALAVVTLRPNSFYDSPAFGGAGQQFNIYSQQRPWETEESALYLTTSYETTPNATQCVAIGGANGAVEESEGSVTGQVVNAIDNRPIAGAEVCTPMVVSCAISDENGNYTFDNLSPGDIQLEASATDFIKSSPRTVAVASGLATTQNFAISPILEAGQIRIVLTWGENPRDLDSYLFLPNGGEIEYNVKNELVEGSILDVDQEQSFGPETITIQEQKEGKYSYAVHHYTGESTLAASGAKVEVFVGNRLDQAFEIPSGDDEKWWYVFDLDGETGEITPVNQLSDTKPK